MFDHQVMLRLVGHAHAASERGNQLLESAAGAVLLEQRREVHDLEYLVNPLADLGAGAHPRERYLELSSVRCGGSILLRRIVRIVVLAGVVFSGCGG